MASGYVPGYLGYVAALHEQYLRLAVLPGTWGALLGLAPSMARPPAGGTLLLLLLPVALGPTAATDAHRTAGGASSSFDWDALTRLAHRALPPAGADVSSQQDGCEAPAAGLPAVPLAAPPSQEVAQGYLPERLQLGQHINGFQLTSFVRRIPLLPPPAAGRDSVAKPTSLQVWQHSDASAVALLQGLALPGPEGGSSSDALALPAAPSSALALFDPSAVETAVSDSLLALPPASLRPSDTMATATAIGTQVALARVRPANLSPEEQTRSDQMLATLDAAAAQRERQRRAAASADTAAAGLPAEPDGGDETGGVPGYSMGSRIGHGHHGEVWRAVRSPAVANRQGRGQGDPGPSESAPEPPPAEERYVLKRIFVEKGLDIRLSGLREVYFGELLKPRCEKRLLLSHLHLKTIILPRQARDKHRES